MLLKKYFSIAEVADITNLPHYKLRYIEKSNKKIKITKIRGRRYYTISDIELIQNEYLQSANPTLSQTVNYTTVNHNNSQQIVPNSSSNMIIINEIDQLLAKFQKLKKNI
jgi:DNA-binding transcriptional MerR regulator